MRWWLFLAVWTCCTVFALGCSSQPPPRSKPSPLLSNMLPGFDSPTVSGNQLDTSKFYGQTLVVSFVSSNCRACEKTLAAAQGTYADFHDVAVVGIFSKENAANALRLSKKHDLKFPVVADPEGKIAARFQIQEVPVTFVADYQGRVRWVGGLDMTQDGLTAAVRAVR